MSPREYSKNYLLPCTVEGCPNLIYAKGWCKVHYARWDRRGTLDKKGRAKPSPCVVVDCPNLTTRKDRICSYHLKPHVSKAPAARGIRSEYVVSSNLKAFGRKVSRLPNTLGDLLVDDKIILDVKTAHPQHTGKYAEWKFNIHHHGVLNEVCHYYLLCFEDVPEHKYPIYAAFKAPVGTPVLQFSLRSMIRTLAPAVDLFEKIRDGKLELC